MKFSILAFLFISFCSLSAKSQNLVPNPSFEDTIACPTTANQLNNCAFWSVVKESPDYFHECDFIAGNTSVPYNFAGFQYPSNGSAYVGLVTFTEVGASIREIITCELLSPLVVGQKYFASMKISWSGVIATIASNKTGMLFSTQFYSPGSASVVNNFCHVHLNTIITDSLNWTTISGSFVADSNYQYLLLGNFFDDANTDTLRSFPFTSYAYYYIDDIEVVEDTLSSVDSHNINDGLVVFPNPFTDHLNISLKYNKIAVFEIFDTQSKLIETIPNINKNEINLNLSGLSSGFYYGKVITDKETLIIKLFKK